jgi:phosphate transport system substrate-binding protein
MKGIKAIAIGVTSSAILGLGLLALNRSKTTSPMTTLPTKEISKFTEAEGVPSGEFKYGGSTTWIPIRQKIDPVIQSVLPEFKLRYVEDPAVAPGSGTGIKMLLAGKLTFAQSSRSLETSEYQKAQDQGFTLEQIHVAIDGIAIAVHPDLDISGLTTNQLRDIYTGKITNWQQVGGSNLEIVPYSKSPADSGTANFFVEHVLESSPFGSQVKIVTDIAKTLQKIATEKGAIFYASAPEIIFECNIKLIGIGRTPDKLIPVYKLPLVPLNQCPKSRNQLNRDAFLDGSYPLTRNLFVIVKRNKDIEEKAGKAYARLLLTQQGQSMIDEAGFISIR